MTNPGQRKVSVYKLLLAEHVLHPVFLVFNSNGKMPNGMMSYLVSECLERSHYDSSPCDPSLDDWIYPVGHSLSLGSFQVSKKTV